MDGTRSFISFWLIGHPGVDSGVASLSHNTRTSLHAMDEPLPSLPVNWFRKVIRRVFVSTGIKISVDVDVCVGFLFIILSS